MLMRHRPFLISYLFVLLFYIVSASLYKDVRDKVKYAGDELVLNVMNSVNLVFLVVSCSNLCLQYVVPYDML